MNRDLKRQRNETLAQWIDRITPQVMKMTNLYDVQQTLIGISDEAYWLGQFDATKDDVSEH